MADNIAVTPGSGATVAADDVGGVHYQRVKLSWGADGSASDVSSTSPLPVQQMANASTYLFATGNSANVAAGRTTHFDMFNASGSGVIVKVWGVFLIPTLAAVTGVGLTWELIRTSAVGTGGSALTAGLFDTANSAVPAQVTARSKPTGGATGSTVFQYINSSSEETIPYGSQASVLNHIASTLTPPNARAQALVLRTGEGFKVDQTTNSNVGSTLFQVLFTLE